MRRRICLAIGLVALAAPATGWAQSSSQAQYQGVAPETQLPVSGGGGGGSAGGGAAALTGGGTTGATGGGRPTSGANGSNGSKATSGAAGNGGTATGSGGVGAKTQAVALPAATSSTSPFGGSDILWIVIAAAGLTGLGLLLRRSTRRTPAV